MATTHEHTLAKVLGDIISALVDNKIIDPSKEPYATDLLTLQTILQDPTDKPSSGGSSTGYEYIGIDEYKAPSGRGVIHLAIAKGGNRIMDLYWTEDRQWTLDHVGEDEYKRPIFMYAKSKPLPSSESSIRPFLKKIADDEASTKGSYRKKYIEPIAPFARKMVLCEMGGKKCLVDIASAPKPKDDAKDEAEAEPKA